MLAKVLSCAVIGLDGTVVEVEVDSSRGLASFTLVGLPDAAVKESAERVRAAIRNSGLHFPSNRITVNLAPADLKKVGPAYDLPIALGMLIASEQVVSGALQDAIVVGELALDGSVRHVRGVLPMTAFARDQGFKRIFVPLADAAEAALIPGIEVVAVQSLGELVGALNGLAALHVVPSSEVGYLPASATHAETAVDFKDIKGQEVAKRALEVAAAGGHNVLMSGSPGAGKTMLARALPGILPDMTLQEALDVTRIYSVADMLPPDTPLITTRPFRAPHHTISHAGLIGGGKVPRPGEVSLAHRGVLFLDELPEFETRSLEVLRQPMEDKVVTISRVSGSLTFPANFQLVAAMNPCRCGWYGDPVKPCTCSPASISQYQKRISGPLLDRIDIHLEVSRVDYEKLADTRVGETSEAIRRRVQAARQRQAARFAACRASDQSGGRIPTCNADMTVSDVRVYCQLDEAGRSLMKAAVNQLQMSARAFHRVLKLARTIADLAGSERIHTVHLAEALQYRPRRPDA
ncbi:MAG: YifB family Mg chelatase-like AAA ATPase [Anaerolineae bacterium]|nr:YifB family Mg chelatase-like AAA ATPase [Thermoflexales bacterium]MDW8408282.1 YifB family Mg chelatase-like AAA ATPase [Anaerolineae bacterium]